MVRGEPFRRRCAPVVPKSTGCKPYKPCLLARLYGPNPAWPVRFFSAIVSSIDRLERSTANFLSVLRPQRTLRALLVTGANQWQIDVTGADQWQIDAMAFQPAELGGDALARRDEFVRFRIGYRADQKEGGKSRRCALFGLVVKRCDGNQCPD